jgi:hypothetical protein
MDLNCSAAIHTMGQPTKVTRLKADVGLATLPFLWKKN